jgi:hypothetical protein
VPETVGAKVGVKPPPLDLAFVYYVQPCPWLLIVPLIVAPDEPDKSMVPPQCWIGFGSE